MRFFRRDRDEANKSATRKASPTTTTKSDEPITSGTSSYYAKTPESLIYAPGEVRSAVITYAWLEDATTSRVFKRDGATWRTVYSGAWITTRRIAECINEKSCRVNGMDEQVISQRTVERHIAVLRREGLIRTERKPGGLRIAVRVYVKGEPAVIVDKVGVEIQEPPFEAEPATQVAGRPAIYGGSINIDDLHQKDLYQENYTGVTTESGIRKGNGIREGDSASAEGSREKKEARVDPEVWERFRRNMNRTLAGELEIAPQLRQKTQDECLELPRWARCEPRPERVVESRQDVAAGNRRYS